MTDRAHPDVSSRVWKLARAWKSNAEGHAMGTAKSGDIFRLIGRYLILAGAAAMFFMPYFLTGTWADLKYFVFQSTLMMTLFLAYYMGTQMRAIRSEGISRVLKTTFRASLWLLVLWPFVNSGHEALHALAARWWAPDSYIVVPGWQQISILWATAFAGCAAIVASLRSLLEAFRGKGLENYRRLKWWGFWITAIPILGLTLLAFGLNSGAGAPGALDVIFGPSPLLDHLRWTIRYINPLDNLSSFFRGPHTFYITQRAVWEPFDRFYYDILSGSITRFVFLLPTVVGALGSMLLFKLASRRNLMLQIVAFGLAAYATFGGMQVDFALASDGYVAPPYLLLFCWWLAWEFSNVLDAFARRLFPSLSLAPQGKPFAEAGFGDQRIFGALLAVTSMYWGMVHLHTTGFSLQAQRLLLWIGETFHLSRTRVVGILATYGVLRIIAESVRLKNSPKIEQPHTINSSG